MREPFEHDPQPESSLTGAVQPPEVSSGNCGIDGHDFEMVVSMDGELLRLLCVTCGSQWKAERL